MEERITGGRIVAPRVSLLSTRGGSFGYLWPRSWQQRGV